MSKQTRIIGIVRPWTGHPADRQIAAVKAAGASVILIIPDECATWRKAVGLIRRGDVAAVHWLQLIAEPKSAKVRHPAMDMRDALEEIERRGGVVVEAGTGRRSDDAKQRAEMIADAARSLGAGGRSLSSEQARINGAQAGAKRGRRRSPIVDANKTAAESIWYSRKVATWKDADKLLRPLGWTMYRAHLELGPRDGSQKPKR